MAHKKVYLIRHGMTLGNSEKRYIGRENNEPLCPEGIMAVRKLGSRIPDDLLADIDRVFSSPLQRAMQTAEILFPGRNTLIHLYKLMGKCTYGLYIVFHGKIYV